MLQNGDMHNIEPSPKLALNDIVQHLHAYDSDWLTQTLEARYVQLTNQSIDQNDVAQPQSPVNSLDATLQHLPRELHLNPYIQAFRDHAWDLTELGPMASWSLELRKHVNQSLYEPQAAAIIIGPKLLTVYNEPYSMLIGARHPLVLGHPFSDIWPESSLLDAQTFLDSAQLSEISWGENTTVIVERSDSKEQLWISWINTPITDDTGSVMGLYHKIRHDTAHVHRSRRTDLLASMNQAVETAVQRRDFWKEAIHAWNAHPIDIPFAAVYSLAGQLPVSRDPTTEQNAETGIPRASSDRNSARPWILAGTVGTNEADSYPYEIDSDLANEMFGSQFSNAMTSAEPLVLDLSSEPLAALLSSQSMTSKQRPRCQFAILFPICPGNHNDIYGFVLLGLNPLCRYDAEYQQFAKLLKRQLETSLASVLLAEAGLRELHVAAERATRNQIRLQAQLAESQLEVIESRSRFRGMVDIAPLAMFHLDQTGEILYANQNWVDITQHTTTQWGKRSWFDTVHQEDRETVDAEWNRLLKGQSVNFSMRWEGDYAEREKFYIGDVQLSGPTWTIATAYPELRPDGSVKSIVGCLTDISKQKWLEDFQERRMHEALALKRQQENFMDMISHEARNPLSAIMLCTESILELLNAMVDANGQSQLPRDSSMIIKGIEDAEIIMTCAQHQKRMIDDVLTLSKIDAGLLLIEPDSVQVKQTIAQALKIFDVELEKHSIEKNFVVHPSYGALSVNWLRLDPNRLLQVLINLIGNAIKFTKGEATKRIDITLSASFDRPTTSLMGIKYIPRATEATDENEQNVFIALEVQDTGCGIQPSEIERLFQKFQQATPKTHVEYGGSGLGLFISRQLTNMLGGSIGAKSNPSGASFGFYVCAPRCEAPQTHTTRSKAVPSPQLTVLSRKRALEEDSETARQDQKWRPHILIVEDNVINQKVLRSQLERLHYPVSVANHGLEALDYVKTSRFCQTHGEPLDVILLDVEMPVCTGLECARRIRTWEEMGTIRGHIPIIGVTANARAEQQKAALDAGMNAVVTKPFRLKDLSRELDKIVEPPYNSD